MCKTLQHVFCCIVADKYVVNCGLTCYFKMYTEGLGRGMRVTQRKD